jgi:hypothetical protein
VYLVQVSYWLEDCANFTTTPEENDQYSATHFLVQYKQQANPLLSMHNLALKCNKRLRPLFRPKISNTCHQMPNPSREPVSLTLSRQQPEAVTKSDWPEICSPDPWNLLKPFEHNFILPMFGQQILCR